MDNKAIDSEVAQEIERLATAIESMTRTLKDLNERLMRIEADGAVWKRDISDDGF